MKEKNIRCGDYKTDSEHICYLCGRSLCINKKCKNYGTCAYTKTVDHIPPRQLFKNISSINKRLEINKQNLFTAYCCQKCNNEYSIYDDAFVSLISLQSEGLSGNIINKINNKHILEKLGKSHFKFIKSFNGFDYLYSKHGNVILSNQKYPTANFDMDAINLVNKKVIKGIYYKEFKEILRKDIYLKYVPYSICNINNKNILNNDKAATMLIDIMKFLENDKVKQKGLSKKEFGNTTLFYKNIVKDMFSYLLRRDEQNDRYIVILKYFTDVFYFYSIE